jgi:hypothetical protein
MADRTLTTAVRLKDLVDTKTRLWQAMEDVGEQEEEGSRRRALPPVDAKTLDIGQTRSPQALSAHPEWNSDGNAEDICDDMYVEIFRRLAAPGNLGLVRCVCRRWQKLVDAPFHRLWPAVVVDNLKSWGNHCGPATDGVYSGPSEAFVLEGQILRFGPDRVAIFREFGDYSGFRLLEKIRAMAPTAVTNITVRYVTPHEIKVRATIDTNKLLPPTEALLWRLSKLTRTGKLLPRAASETLYYGAILFDRGQHVPWETVDPTLLPAAKLYDHQRCAAAWLKRTEEKVVAHAPLATNAFYLRTAEHAGRSALGKDLLRGRWPRDEPRPSFDIHGRGVIVGCEVSVGKTHAVAAFLLGCQQHVPGDCVPEAEPGKIKFTCALDFGNSPDSVAVKDSLCRGLIVTQAALVIVPNTVMNAWAQVMTALRPGARIVRLSNKREHELCSYEDIVMAHVVLVSRQFLMTGSYYREFCNAGRVGEAAFLSTNDGSSPGKVLGRGRHVNFPQQYERFAKWAYGNPDYVTPGMRRPLLHLFAWPRLVVDEVHEIYTPFPTIPEVEWVSARFVVGISATMYGKMAYAHSPPIADALWTKFLGLGVRVNGFPRLAAALHHADVRTGVRGKPRGYADGPMPFRPHYAAAPNEWRRLARLTAFLSGVDRLDVSDAEKRPFQRPRDIGRLNALVANTAVRAIYWRNTQVGVERECPIAQAVEVSVSVPVHPLQRAIAKLLKWSTSRAADVPILVPLVPTHSDHTAPSEPENFSTAPLGGADLTEYPRYFTAMVGRFLEEARAEAQKLRDEAAAYTNEKPAVEAHEKLMRNTKAATIESRLDELVNFDDIVRDYFAPRIARSVFVDEVERLYGTKVSLLFRYLDAIHERYPAAQSIVAVGYVKALAAVFDHLHLKVRNRPYASIGGKNLAATNKELARFNSGGARVLLLNIYTAASGLNLQIADYVFFIDERTPEAVKIQFRGRAARSKRRNKVAVFNFYSTAGSLAPVEVENPFVRLSSDEEEEGERDDPMQIDLVSESDSD